MGKRYDTIFPSYIFRAVFVAESIMNPMYLPILCSLADVYVAFHLLQQLQHQYQQLLQQV